MITRLLITTAVAVFVAATAIGAQAAVVGPASSAKSAAQALDVTEQARRICQRKLRCVSFLNCRWEQTCFVTKDYPPEHGRR